MSRSIFSLSLVFVVLLISVSCKSSVEKQNDLSMVNLSDVSQFITAAEQRLENLSLRLNRAQWVQENFITQDTEALSADANKDYIAAVTELVETAHRFDGLQLPVDTSRKLKLINLLLLMPAPSAPAERDELTKIAAAMVSEWSSAKYCPNGERGKCFTLDDLSKILATNRNPEDLEKAWSGWHSIGASHRDQYARFVELANKGVREMGFKDLGAMWRSNYDMEPEEFAAEAERLWLQVKPLYDSLHAYARKQLIKKYDNKIVPESGPIPAHLFGNMYAQDWTGLYDLLRPAQRSQFFNLTGVLQTRNVEAKGIAKIAENFFISLGFDPLPETFWKRSLFVKPQDREVNCGGNAWHIDNQRDVRLKMCININEADFRTLHHELGHNYYQLAYSNQPFLFKEGANGGFHEAIGEAVALSITPEYLKKIGFIEKAPYDDREIEVLLQRALDDVAFLPFAYLVDQWRWKVFSGEVKPRDYNKVWWELREKYQGITFPQARSEKDFDPWAKGHIPGNYPYSHYFVAAILKFQFHRALCREAGITSPLHLASIYDSKKAGEKLKKMLEMGKSRPWPEAMKVLTGEDNMDATAMLDYFAPLKIWLDEQNRK